MKTMYDAFGRMSPGQFFLALVSAIAVVLFIMCLFGMLVRNVVKRFPKRRRVAVNSFKPNADKADLQDALGSVALFISIVIVLIFFAAGK